MADGSLASNTNPRNDIRRLVRFLDSAFHYCRTQPDSDSTDEYVYALKTVIGLGYTAVVVNHELPIHTQALEQFLHQRWLCFATYEGDLQSLATAVAYLIDTAFESFEALHFPGYYGYFIGAVYPVLDHEILHGLKKREEAWELFHLLLQKRS